MRNQSWKVYLLYVLCVILAAILNSPLHAEENPTVNVNTADAETLQFLPGVGPAKADNILYAREQGLVFRKITDLTQIHGIGPKTAEKLAPYVIFEGEGTAKGPIGKKEGSSTSATKYRRPSEGTP